MADLPALLLQLDRESVSYVNFIKPLLQGRATTYIDSTIPVGCFEYADKAKKKGCTGVITCNQALLEKLLPDVSRPKIDDYQGSIIKRFGMEFLIIGPLDNLLKTNTGKFITSRWIDKFLKPNIWPKAPPFKWELFSPEKVEELKTYFSMCDLIAIDIETIRGDAERAMECVSFTGCILASENGGEIALRTVVVPCDSLFNIIFIRILCALPNAKTFQNGKYDIAYLFRFGCPVTNYAFDTINLFHSWLSELPKDLGFISAFMVRDYEFHKSEGSLGGKYARLSYNGKDTYYTLLATLGLLQELPEYAIRNYLMEFPVVFPSILCEHTGFSWDTSRARQLELQVKGRLEKDLERLRTMVDNPYYNPNSSQQTVRLFQILGSKDITSSDAINTDKVAARHPLNKRILGRIGKYRENSKLASTYLHEGIPWLGRCYYSINPHGTDTGRLASKQSQFWCGLQIQNIPTDDGDAEYAPVKECFIAEEDFYIGEADYSKNETWGTAYITGDEALLAAVSDVTKDFHGLNASQFFGIPYEEIVRSTFNGLEWIHKTVNKLIRDLSKRTNHGANYNMGAQVLLDTMGIENVIRAKKLLGLPQEWALLKVTAYLLEVFDKTYPIVRGQYHEWVKSQVTGTGFLVGPTGWTRRCFGKPIVNKRDLNSYVAHPPQSLGAMLLNKAFNRVFRELWCENNKNFRMNAQIHDSILFQYRKGHEHLAWQVRDCMIAKTPITDIFGKTRVMTVPVDLKGGAARWSEITTLKQEIVK